MSWTAQSAAAGLIGVGLYSGVSLFAPDVPPFLEVEEMRALNGGEFVYVRRSIPEPGGVADWRVTVVNEDAEAPVCQTIPGKEQHAGWSRYEPSASYERTMSLDVWAGDPGCYERLLPGKHTEYVTWTPRDGREPVTHRREFVKEAD